MEEPAGLHRIYDGPVGTFYDERTHGPLQLELRRVKHEKWVLLRRFGYRDHRYDEPFVCPHDVDDYDTDLASIPWFFQWVVPGTGTHFPAIMLHDALVVGEDDDPTHLGPAVTREEADRIMRDAMGHLGVGFVRRWLAWTGAMMATVATMRPRWWWLTLLVVTFLPIVALGILATIDLLDWAELLPWMGDRNWLVELGAGAVGALVIPALLSILWWRRWRAGLIAGVTLAFLVHVTLLMFAAYGVYRVLEWLTTSRTRSEEDFAAEQALLESHMRVSDQVGKGSATFVDLRIPRSFVRISVTGPGMLVDGLRLVTDLGILEGHSEPALQELSRRLEATAHCGSTGPTSVDVEVVVDRQGPALRVGVGPESMYESVIEVTTTDGSSIEKVLKETIASGTGRGFVAAFVPIATAGNPEDIVHDHGGGRPGHDDRPGHEHEPTHEPARPVEVVDAAHEELAGHGHA